jgi:hypothetical protein
MGNDLLDAISRYTDDMVGFTRDLVAIPTENPPGAAYRTCIDRIRGELDRLGLETTLIEVPHSGPEAGEPRYCLRSGLGWSAKGDLISGRFHGGEYTLILVSTTESDRAYLLASCEFLLDSRRLTVALSQPKRKMILVASRRIFLLFSTDEETFANLLLWKNLLLRTYSTLLWERERSGKRVTVD